MKGVVVLHVPHASTAVPADLRAALTLSDEDLERELLRMTDHFTDRLFPVGAVAEAVVYPVSRLVADPERFADDAEEPMAARGMGVVYTATSQCEPLRPSPGADERESLLERYYRPHHARLEAAVTRVLAAHGRCLIVDAHSFPSRPLPYEVDQDPVRPSFCIGTDAFHTPSELTEAAVTWLTARGHSVAVDRPFAGTMVPASQHGRDRRVASIMVEVRRDLYMDEATGEQGAGFERVRAEVGELVVQLARTLTGLGCGRACEAPQR